MELRTGRHCVFALHVYLVFVTKYRRGVLTDEALQWLRIHFTKACAMQGALLEACDGEDDHVRLLVNYPPSDITRAISQGGAVDAELFRGLGEQPRFDEEYYKVRARTACFLHVLKDGVSAKPFDIGVDNKGREMRPLLFVPCLLVVFDAAWQRYPKNILIKL